MTRVVRQVERFGEYSYVYLNGGSTETAEAWIAKVPGGCYGRSGEVMCFGFDPEHCHVFDGDGLALPRLLSK